MFGYLVNRWSFQFVRLCEFLGFNSFWINVFLWLPVQLALLEIKIKYGSLQNYLDHCDSKRNS